MPCGRPSRQSATVNGRHITYELHRNARRRKTMTISIEGQQLRVLSPVRTPQQEIDDFIRLRADWIAKRLAVAPPSRLRAELRDGGSLPMLGDRYPVVDSSVPFDFDGERFLVDVHRPDCAAVAEGWFRDCARAYFTDRVEDWSPRIGVRPRRIQIRNQKTRWGSASTKGTLSFNWRLIFARPAIVEYIVVHELCHLHRPDHSAQYWALVGRHLPNYESQRRWLKEHGESLRW